MMALRFALLPDGSSDISLMPILKWLLIENGVRCAIQGEFVKLGKIKRYSAKPLPERIHICIETYPADFSSIGMQKKYH